MLGLPAVALLLAASPQVFEDWGFTLDVSGRDIVVTQVRENSPADSGLLQPGSKLVRIVRPAPTRPRAMGALSASAFDDVVAALREVQDDELLLQVRFGKSGDEKLLRKGPPGVRTRRRPEQRTGVLLRLPAAETPLKVRVDPATHRVASVERGDATGEWAWVRTSVGYACRDARAQRLTVRNTAGGPEGTLDVSRYGTHGGQQDVSFPVARLKELTGCPAEPVEARFELEVTCANGTQEKGADVLLLAVRCAPADRSAFESLVFDATVPRLSDRTLRAGAPSVQVRHPMVRVPVRPRTLRAVVAAHPGGSEDRTDVLWSDPGDGEEESPELAVPAPRAPGRYQVRLEAEWPDGSTSRSAPADLTVLSAGEAEAKDRDFREGSKNFFALDARVRKEGIDLCDKRRAVPWLRAQPEVERVDDPGGESYSYVVKKNPAPALVHCHPPGTR